MKKQKELLKNTIVLMVGKICTQFISFLLLPLYTTVLTSREYGVVDLVTTYIGLLVPLITLQLEMALFRFLVDARKDDKEKKNIISNSYVTAGILLLITLIIYVPISLIFNFDYQVLLILMVIATASSSLSLQTIRGLGDNIGYAIGSIIAGGLTILCNVIFLVVFNMGVEGIFLSIILANLACFIFILIRQRLLKYMDIKVINKEMINKLLKYSLPLVPNGIIWWVINASDRTIISIILSASSNGIYAVSNKFSNVFINIFYIFNMSWTESVALHIDDDQDGFLENMVNASFSFFSSVCLMIIATMPFIFTIMVGTAYKDAYNYIPILLLSTLFNIMASMFGAVYVAKKRTIQIAKTSLYAGLINILINVLLIRYIGLYAAAISTLIAFAVMALYRYIDIQKYVKIHFKSQNLIAILLLSFISICLYYSNNMIVNIINFILMLFFMFTLNKDTIKSLIMSIKKKVRL